MADVVNLGHLAAGFGAGAVTVGAAYGIGRIAGAAMEGSARNPQAGRRRTDVDDYRLRVDRRCGAFR